MTREEQQSAFADEVWNVVDRYWQETDLQVPDIVGILTFISNSVMLQKTNFVVVRPGDQIRPGDEEEDE